MKRAILAICCCVALLANGPGAMATPAADQDMASRYLRAAQSGDDDAQFYIGALYAAGVGVPRSDQEAFRWFSRATDQGHSHAMLILAGLYAVGRGVHKDNVKAYRWAYIVSNASRVDEFRDGSRQLMGVLEGRMTPEEIKLAKSEADRWHAVATNTPTPPAPPPDTSSNAPPAAPPPVITTAAPIAPAPPPPAASSPRPPAKTTSDDSSSPLDTITKNVKKGDIDGLLDQVPQGLRKKLGF